MTTYSYARVSTTGQNVQQQADYLDERYNIDISTVEKFTGKTTERPKFKKLLRKLKAGDVLVVKEVSRIGRNTSEVLEVVDDLKDRGVKLIIDQLGGTDVTSPAGAMILTVMAGIATMERESMLERQRIGIARAQAEGKYKGRQRISDTVIKKAIAMVEAGESVENSAAHWGISRATLYNRINGQK